MLDEYKEMCFTCANLIPGWESMSKNDLCRAYVANKGNDAMQNAYISAILYKYWNLIPKYYHQSENCATPEECYGWLVDSVSCCVNLASWENPESSIYNDPNGPDKVINRCMKCARLTYYQFINRKKRKEDFGLLSVEELRELYGNTITEPSDPEQECDVSSVLITDFVVEEFRRKNYFVAFVIFFIVSGNVFDVVITDEGRVSEFNIRKMCKIMNNVSEDHLLSFSDMYHIDIDDVRKAYSYVSKIPQANMRKKILQALEDMKHSSIVTSLIGGN